MSETNFGQGEKEDKGGKLPKCTCRVKFFLIYI
jgi:hypothetical protein